jgi:hypothetical protein
VQESACKNQCTTASRTKRYGSIAA